MSHPTPTGTPTGTPAGTPHGKAHGAWLFYVVALVATLVSIDTSWRFFGERLHIVNPWERPAMFAVIELALVASALSMRGGVRRGDGPGPARLLVWGMCGASAYMAVTLAGVTEGVARLLLGPLLAVVCLHLALGIDMKVSRVRRSGTWARIGRELKERALSRLGLADDARDALARTRDRAADRAARLATTKWTPLRTARLGRAVRASGASLDAIQRERVMAGVATLRGLSDLTGGTWTSPWVQEAVTRTPFFPGPVEVPVTRVQQVPTVPGPRVQVPRTSAPRTPSGSWDTEKAVRLVLEGVQQDQDIADLVGIGSKTIQRVRRAAVLLRGDLHAEVPSAWKVPGALVDLIRTEVAR